MHKKQDSANNLFKLHKNQIFTSEKIVKKVKIAKNFRTSPKNALTRYPIRVYNQDTPMGYLSHGNTGEEGYNWARFWSEQ